MQPLNFFGLEGLLSVLQRLAAHEPIRHPVNSRREKIMSKQTVEIEEGIQRYRAHRHTYSANPGVNFGVLFLHHNVYQNHHPWVH